MRPLTPFSTGSARQNQSRCGEIGLFSELSRKRLSPASMLEAGVNVSVSRLPQVHDRAKRGLVTYLVDLARWKGVSAGTVANTMGRSFTAR